MRISSLAHKQWLPSWLVFIGYSLFFIAPEIRQSDLYTQVLSGCVFTFLLRVLSSFYIFSIEKSKSDQWFKMFENIIALYYFVLGVCYSVILIISDKIYPEYNFVFYIFFFFVTLGALRSAVSSFKSSVTHVLGSYLPILFYSWGGLPLHITFLFTVGILFMVTYLISSQYRLGMEYVFRHYLQDEQAKHIEDLKTKLLLEAELKKQKAINVQNARLTSLGEMAAGIAHEINNPLTIIALHVKTMDRKIESEGFSIEDWKKISANILTAVERSSKIIASLRSFSRDDKLSEIEVVPFKVILDETLVFIQKRFTHHKIDFGISFECDESVVVSANRVACSQVLVNLLNNSFDEMNFHTQIDSSWCTIIIRENKNLLEVRVVDAGTGIPEEVEDKIFTPFFTSKAPGEGTGLGLSLSKNMMRDMGGDLVYENSATNTTFLMTLPIVK